jgi:hypothetical protein
VGRGSAPFLGFHSITPLLFIIKVPVVVKLTTLARLWRRYQLRVNWRLRFGHGYLTGLISMPVRLSQARSSGISFTCCIATICAHQAATYCPADNRVVERGEIVKAEYRKDE